MEKYYLIPTLNLSRIDENDNYVNFLKVNYPTFYSLVVKNIMDCFYFCESIVKEDLYQFAIFYLEEHNLPKYIAFKGEVPIKYKIFLPQQVKLREEITNSKLIIPRTCLIDNEVDKVKYLDYLKNLSSQNIEAIEKTMFMFTQTLNIREKTLIKINK